MGQKRPQKDQTIHTFDHLRFLKTVSNGAGVYQMYDQSDQLLYIGKAINLRKRLSNYFQKKNHNTKTEKLVSLIAYIEISRTENSSEALILEQNLIKAHQPPYNVLLRDDKSYPYIFLSNHKHPRLSMVRNRKKTNGQYFGPFPNIKAVKQTVNFLQKSFKIRDCNDSVYNNRSRPCLQYQINRCLAPCCFNVTDEYNQSIHHTTLFLQGDSLKLREELILKMESAASNLAFEEASMHRDSLQELQYIQSNQNVETGANNLEVLASVEKTGVFCIHCLSIREGKIIGSTNHFFKKTNSSSPSEVLGAFISQYFLNTPRLPKEIIINHAIVERDVLEHAYKSRTKQSLSIKYQVSAQRKKWQQLCEKNAHENLDLHLNTSNKYLNRTVTLQQQLNLKTLPTHIECFDISHHSGQHTVASCVVFIQGKPTKNEYRTFNIENITPGDDYAAMHQAISRRYQHILNADLKIPDLILIDGGKGQLGIAKKVLQALNLPHNILLGVSKGKERKAGQETLHLTNNQTIHLPPHSPALHLIQHVRDEAHRFAVYQHNKKKRASQKSTLEHIPSIGQKRRQLLLNYFGGLQQLKTASVEDLCQIPGISKKTSEIIYNYFREIN
jgi:excinuclease ABC subunit C